LSLGELESHRLVVDRALTELGLGWDAWPGLIVTAPLTAEARLSAVLLLLSLHEVAAPTAGHRMLLYDPNDERLDWLGRARQPWDTLARLKHPWTRSPPGSRGLS
jgi:hypothetical protein